MKVLEQIEKQLHKLVDVLRVSELGQGAYVEREIMLVKIQASGYGGKRNATRRFSAGKSSTSRRLSIPYSWRAPAISWMRFWQRCAKSLKLLRCSLRRGGAFARRQNHALSDRVRHSPNDSARAFFAKSVEPETKAVAESYSALRCYNLTHT
jgi:acetolactate synthase small subunit